MIKVPPNGFKLNDVYNVPKRSQVAHTINKFNTQQPYKMIIFLSICAY